MIRVASHWKATIHIYNLKKFQKIQKFIAFTSACLESLNPTYGSPKPLGVKCYKWLDASGWNLVHSSYDHIGDL
jgi:hypothetical protein